MIFILLFNLISVGPPHWVETVDPSRMFEETCIIKAPGQLEVIAEFEEMVLARYTTFVKTMGTECSNNVKIMMPREEFDQIHDEYIDWLDEEHRKHRAIYNLFKLAERKE